MQLLVYLPFYVFFSHFLSNIFECVLTFSQAFCIFRCNSSSVSLAPSFLLRCIPITGDCLRVLLSFPFKHFKHSECVLTFSQAFCIFQCNNSSMSLARSFLLCCISFATKMCICPVILSHNNNNNNNNTCREQKANNPVFTYWIQALETINFSTHVY